MKTKNYSLLVFCIVALTSCKKNIDGLSDTSTSTPQVNSLATQATHLPLTVETIAGNVGRDAADAYGYKDGVGTDARFNYPLGIDLQPDGSILVADNFNKKIRKVSPTNVVSTVSIPTDPTYEFGSPRAVKTGKDGTLYILMDYSHYPRNFWIVKPNGSLVFPPYKKDYNYADIIRDPYNDYFWLCGGKPTYVNNSFFDYRGLIEKLLISTQGSLGKDPFVIPQKALTPVEQENALVTTMYIGYNNVKYIAILKSIYKYTPSGVFTRITKYSLPYNVGRLIANKDSKTLYASLENGAIYALSGDNMRYLVGPNGTNSGSDGTGKNADVYDFDLALSKDENTLYFTDPLGSSVRILYLK